MNRRLSNLLTGLAFGALAVGASACVIRESPGVNRGYGYGYAQAGYQGDVMVGNPSPYYVSSMPPEALYETMTTSPGCGYVWIDGYWNWNGYEWVWVSGRWVTEQQGYVYVQPYYDWADDGRYVYYPGHWSHQNDLDSRVRVVDHRDGRPTTGYYPTGNHDRPHTVDHRGDGGTVGGGGTSNGWGTSGGGSHDHRGDGGGDGGTTTTPPSHDHRGDGSNTGSSGNDNTTPQHHEHRQPQGDVKPPDEPKHDTSVHEHRDNPSSGGTTTVHPVETTHKTPRQPTTHAPSTKSPGNAGSGAHERAPATHSPSHSTTHTSSHDHRH